jgi:PPP family 3-phenylpropionic acid transporter
LRAGRAGDISFGVSRAIGSIAFVVGNLAGGALIARFGISAAIAWLIAAATAMVAASWFALKPDPAPPSAATHNFYSRLAAALALFKRRRFALAMIASGLVQAAHAFYYGFSSLAWTQQGFGAATIGALWAVGVVAEVILFMTLRVIEPRVTPERLVMIGAAGALVRWGVMMVSPPLWVLWPLQILHAASFTATHVGALRIVEREAPPELAGSGMVLYAMLAAGTPMGLATLGSGWLYDHYGAGGYGAMAVMAAIGLGVSILMVMRPAREG